MRLRRSVWGPFWGCERYPECKGTHGAHADGMPLGVPATHATKRARMRTHKAFDLIWSTRLMPRSKAYAWLAERLGVPEIHIGASDEALCERIIVLVHESFPELFQVKSESPDDK